MKALTLFVSPKRGGILQSSGFLDLKSLMALNRTCKANMIDELSFMLLIENEITRNHGAKTREEAIEFWRNICRRKPLLKRWLTRDNTEESIKVTLDMLSVASHYEVMLAKMLRTVQTDSERAQLLSGQDPFGRTVLHFVTRSGNLESIKTVLAVHPESEVLKVLNLRDHFGWTALHGAAHSGNSESIRLILANYRTESERLQAVSVTDQSGWNVLHCAAWSGKSECLETILDLYPESERLQALTMTNQHGDTVLHWAAGSKNIECIKAVLSLFPESQRLQVLNEQNGRGKTVLDNMDEETRQTVMEWLSKSVSSVSKQS